MTKKQTSSWLSYLLLILTVLFWAGNFVVGRGIREVIPPVSLNFWRWVGAFVILLPLSLPQMRKQSKELRRHWRIVFLLSIPSVTLFNTLIYSALQSTTTINTVLITATIPVIIAILVWIFFHETLGLRQAIGVVVSFVGLLFILSRGDIQVILGLSLSRGDLWTLAAALCWATYSVFLRKKPATLHPLSFLTAITGFGLLTSLPFYLWELSHRGGFSLTAKSGGALLYICIFPSVLAYLFWNKGVAEVGANRAGVFIHLMPLFAILLACIFLGEQLHLFHFFGMLLIFGGILMTTLPAQSS